MRLFLSKVWKLVAGELADLRLFLRRIWRFARVYRTRLFLGLACGVVYALTNGLLILAVKLVVNLVFSPSAKISFADEMAKVPSFLKPLADHLVGRLPELSSPSSPLGKIVAISFIPAIMLIRCVLGYLNVYLMNWSALRAVADLRTELFGHLQNLDMNFFSHARTGDLISRITADTGVIANVISGSFASMIKDPVTVLVLLAVMFYQQPMLTLVSMVVLPVCVVPMNIYNRKVRKSTRIMQSQVAELITMMHESFTGNRIIKAYNLEDTVLGEFRKTTASFLSHTMRVIRANEIPSQLTEFLGALGVALVLLFVTFHMSHSPGGTGPSAGDFVAFILSIVVMYQPIKSLTRLYNQLHQAAAASEQAFKLLETTTTIKDPPNPVPLNAANADIEFDNLSFDYGDKPILRGINLTIKAGQMVALVGATGSGKTTLANLLLRFYDPTSGAVRIGGTDIRQVALKDLRRQIALVAQENILLNNTTRQNIALGRPGATDKEIEAAATHAYARQFILDKPQGFDTVIGEKGTKLSGGQRQRLTIARAILRNSPILVLDEATSSLDTESERAVQAALDDLMQDRTTLCIAHRLSTIQRADLIAVLDQGRIVETGTHEQLMAARGIYCKLYEIGFSLPAA